MAKSIDSDLSFIFNPKSVILMGISRTEGKTGHFIAMNMQRFFSKINSNQLCIIHPDASEIRGIPCYKAINAIPEKLMYEFDLAIIALPVKYITDAVIECIKVGVKGILIESGNIGNEKDEIDRNRNLIFDAVSKYTTKEGKRTRIMGPNSLGLLNNANHFFTGIMNFPDFPPFHPNEHNVSIIAQTGLILSGYLMDLFEQKDIPISKICAIGNKMDVDESSILETLIQDPLTKVIAMYLEGIKDGRKFFQLCKQAIFNAGKIVILLTSGRSELGKRAISSHTSSIATNTTVVDAMCRQLGIIQVNDFPELMLAAKLAVTLPLPKGNRLGLISISGAGCVLSTDFASKYGFEVPALPSDIVVKIKEIFPDWAEIANPLDLWASIEQYGAEKCYNLVLNAFLESKAFDAIIFCNIAGTRALVDFVTLRGLRKQFPDIPLILELFGGLNEIKKKTSINLEQNCVDKNTYIPTVNELERSIRILSQLLRIRILREKFIKN
jgi:acyl-CoA synthetase (NDP forming)